jgi:hypothetical protein
MNNTLESPSLEVAKNYIYFLDFSNIIHKMVNYNGWRLKDATQVCNQYRNFLFLNKKYGETVALPPSEDIDEFWHHHILDTQQYRKDCQAIFGKFFDHYPYFGVDEKSTVTDLNKAFESFLKLYRTEFNVELKKVRGFAFKMSYIMLKPVKKILYLRRHLLPKNSIG